MWQSAKYIERDVIPEKVANALESAHFSPPAGTLARIIHVARASVLVIAPFAGISESIAQETPPARAALSSPRPVVSRGAEEPQKIRRCDGSVMTGLVEAIEPKSIRVKNRGDGVIQVIPASAVLQVVSYSKKSTVEVAAEGRALLKDGSYFSGRSFALKERKLSFEVDATEILLPAESVRALQFSNDPSYQADWRALILRQKNRYDSIVIKKGPGILDHIDGIVGEVTADKVSFHYDGEDIQVPRAKLYGVIFSTVGAKPTAAPSCYVHGVGYMLACKQVSMVGEVVTAETVAGATIKFPRDLVTIDYSPSRTSSLQQLSPRVVTWNPFAGVDAERLSDVMIDGRNEPILHRRAFVTDIEAYDVELYGELAISVPLRGHYSILSATVGLDQQLMAMSLVADGQPLEARVERQVVNNADVRNLYWNVSGKRDLAISVGAGTSIRLNDLRFVKAVTD